MRADGLEAIPWLIVFDQAEKLAESCREKYAAIREATAELPRTGFISLWYCPEKLAAFADFGDWTDLEVLESWKDAISKHASVVCEYEHGAPGPEGAWVLFDHRPKEAIRFADEKIAYSPTLRNVGSMLGFFPNALSEKIPIAQSPMAAALASGLVGAGIGHLGSRALTSVFYPKKWKEERAHDSATISGALAGLALPAAWAGTNYLSGKPLIRSLTDGALLGGKPDADLFSKAANFQSATGLGSDEKFKPFINVDEFNHAIWHDPRVADRLPYPIQSAASGLMSGAARLSGDRWPAMVSIGDISRMAVGMGSGYATGTLVGEALGVLLGMPESAQERLKSMGLWAGVIKNVVPMAFGQ